MKKILAFLLFLTFLISLSACGAKKVEVDYPDETAFEAALAKGENLQGKTVTFIVQKLNPQSAFGYNLIAGEHLNFVSDKNPKANEGDIVTVRVKEVKSFFGSWIISYEKLSVSAGAPNTQSEIVEVEEAAQDAVDSISTEKDVSFYCGTWDAKYYETKNGKKYSISQLEEAGNFNLTHLMLILDSNMNAILSSLEGIATGKWSLSENGILLDSSSLTKQDGYLLCSKNDEVYWFEKVSDDQELGYTKSADFYYGTWAVCGISANGQKVSIQKAIEAGASDIGKLTLVIQRDGTANFVSPDSTDTHSWKPNSKGIEIDGSTLFLSKDWLILSADGSSIFFEKVSTEETVPVVESDSPVGIRQEFKEAMDAYEAFYDEYCNLIQEYKEHPSDFSILMKYSEMLTKVADIDEKFAAWKDGDMSDEELKYYLDVSTRIQKKLVDLY